MKRHKAVGIHVFAGGFTMGVQRIADVQCQLERHNFGGETCEAVCKVPFVNHADGAWPHVDADWAYGNPRCTGFSTITSGYGDSCHGAWSDQTEDVHDLCNYAAGRYDLIIWESVQQAYTVGRPLLDYLRDEIFKPKHYRIAHVFINAASFGNVQQRKRYFFVAYHDDRNFNITPPDISPWMRVAYDVLWPLRGRETHESNVTSKSCDYDFDTYTNLTPDEKASVPHLPNGWDLNKLAQYGLELLPHYYQQMWNQRTSCMPFSMHGVVRMNYMTPHPTIHSSAARFIHPEYDRPLTVGELATAMGWTDIPRGPQPVAQIAKGVVPDVGQWLAEQAAAYLDNAWGKEDWESSYNDSECSWVGDMDCAGRLEKTFNLTRYTGKELDDERYDHVSLRRLDVARRSWAVTSLRVKNGITCGRDNRAPGLPR